MWLVPGIHDWLLGMGFLSLIAIGLQKSWLTDIVLGLSMLIFFYLGSAR